LGEEFDLLVQQVRSHFESIQLGQHQLPHLIASRFFLAFTNNDVSQQFVFSRKLGWNPRYLPRPAWPFEVLCLCVPAQHQAPRLGPPDNDFYSRFQLAAVEAAPFVVPSQPISRAFRIALAEFPDLFLRGCKFLLQIILLGDERLKTLF
jgi:hypothetical protein